MKRLTAALMALTLLTPLTHAQTDTTGTGNRDGEATVVDTLGTADKYTKVILYSDHTWEFFDCGRPVIDTACIFEDDWDMDNIHAFKDGKVEELPEEVDLLLTDAENPYCVPYRTKVYSGFKARRSRSHKGVDLPLNTGDTVCVAFNGVVRYTGTSRETGGYGNMVVIRHSNGLETYYGHLSKVYVNPGEVVKAGEVLGLGGSTGRSTGPHLHFETRYKGHAFDPERVFDFEAGTIRDTTLTLKKHYFSIYSHYGQTDSESKAASGRVIHKVKKGENLGVIARKYGTTVNKICKLNGISAKKTLRIGQRLIVR